MATIKLTFIGDDGVDHTLEDPNITAADIKKFGIARIMDTTVEFLNEQLTQILIGQFGEL